MSFLLDPPRRGMLPERNQRPNGVAGSTSPGCMVTSVVSHLSRRRVLQLGGATLLAAGVGGLSVVALTARVVELDLVVYGATSAGIVAAVQARRMGRTVVLIEPGRHLGGMTTGGLGNTDFGMVEAIGGIAGEFYRRIHAAYAGAVVTPTSPARFTFEPHVARGVFDEMLAKAGVTVYLGQRLRDVNRRGTRIVEIVTDNGQVFRAPMFIDASYEGDLMARAGAAWVIGREGNAAYEETVNGVQLGQTHQFRMSVSPFRVPDKPASGLLPGISPSVAPNGTPDRRIQAYNFRMCLTQAPNRIPFAKPAGFDASAYELLWRYVEAGYRGPFFNTISVGGGKSDANNSGAFSTDHIGANHEYPTAGQALRDSIVAEHRTYQQGLMWLLANDPGMPPAIRDATSAWGLAADEFTATGGWSPQLYVREARRMVSAYVMTEHNARSTVTAADSVGLGSYTMDSHHCQRVVVNGLVYNEGEVALGVLRPYPISYRSIVPSAAQCTNLLVPVCLSASHIAYASIRMEPVFMILAQSAATAAVHAIDARIPVQEVRYAALATRLRADGQILSAP
jgi:FAD-dependent oxidoreductase family protein